MPSTARITVRNARFQQWRALLDNRAKRNRLGEFVVQGVRPITLAVEHGWKIRALLCPLGAASSTWASDLVSRVEAEVYEVAPGLLRELGEKPDETPEIIAIAEIRADRTDRIHIPAEESGLVVVFDRPANPGNLGTVVRSADAFGAHGVVVTGHATDVYDPRAVRASTGSIFAVPVVRLASHREVLDWVAGLRRDGTDIRVVGTDESGTVDLAEHDFTPPTVLVIGNETRGMSAAWRDACDAVARIPMPNAGAGASSLNASAAASVILYEVVRQRRKPTAT